MSHDFASLSPIGVDNGQLDAIGETTSDPPYLSVVLACVDALESRAREDRGCESEIKRSLRKVPFALAGIPRQAHPNNIRAYIHARKHSKESPNVLAFSCERT